MALTRPGRILVTVVVLVALVGGGLFAYTALTDNEIPFLSNNNNGGSEPGETPGECPLTGTDGDVPDRPVLAVKVENAPASRPQSGLQFADIVYEQPVEGGITRYIAIFHCQDAERLGPIRSVRLVDGDIVRQFGQQGSQPLFAHSGGIPEIVAMANAAGLLDIGFDQEPGAYERIVEREMPHNLYTSTVDLYESAGAPTGTPPAMFTYDDRDPTGTKPGTEIKLPFANATNTDSSVRWRWNDSKSAYFRLHGETPHLLEGDKQISTKNVIVQFVQTRESGFVDVTGSPVLEIGAIGEGRAIVFRDGVAIEGTWKRDFAEDVTVFKDARDRVIDLSAGTTWVELFPANLEGAFAFS